MATRSKEHQANHNTARAAQKRHLVGRRNQANLDNRQGWYQDAIPWAVRSSQPRTPDGRVSKYCAVGGTSITPIKDAIQGGGETLPRG